MPKGIYEREPFMKNVKTERNNLIYRMKELGLTYPAIGRALKMTGEAVKAVVDRKRIQDLEKLSNHENY